MKKALARKTFLACGAAIAMVLAATPAFAQQRTFNVPAQSATRSIPEFARQAGLQVIAPGASLRGIHTPALRGNFDVRQALQMMLRGSGLRIVADEGSTITLGGASLGEDQAGDAAADSESAQREIVVTGTTIRGVRPESSPFQSYSAHDIEQTGSVTIDQFVRRIPQNFSRISGLGASTSTTEQNALGADAIDLRGLGVGSTLVLLDGRRLALSSGGRAFDLALLPDAAIDRVEVLTDGASAIYGSDAVGGVVNFVLRRDFHGLEARIGYGAATSGGAGEARASATAGIDWNSGNLIVSANLLSRAGLDASERDFSSGAAPFSLQPRETRESVFANIRQGLFGQSEVGATVVYSRNNSRLVSSTNVGTAQLQTFAPHDEFVFASGRFGTPLFGDIRLDVEGSFSRQATSSPAHFEFPAFNFSFDYTTFSTSRTSDINAKVSGSMFTLPAGSLRFSVGGGFIDDYYAAHSSLAPQPAGLHRDVSYAFGEAQIPLVSPAMGVPLIHRLEANVAARYNDYSDFGSELSPRVGVAWWPVANLKFRGSFSRSFRAPFLDQLNAVNHNINIWDTSYFPFKDIWTPDNSAIMLVVDGGNPGLGPERATTFTVGTDFSVGSSLSGHATYFNIAYRGRIGLADPTRIRIFTNPELFPEAYTVNPTAAQVASVLAGGIVSANTPGVDVTNPAAVASAITVLLDNRLLNIARNNVDGLDFSADYAFGRGRQRFHLGFDVTYILNYTQANSSLSPVIEVINNLGQPADLRGRAYFSFLSGPWRGQLNVNYVDSYTNRSLATPEPVNSWTTVDLAFGWAAPADSPLAGFDIGLSVRNLFNRNPPRVALGGLGGLFAPVNYDSANADPIGRFIALDLRKRF